MDNEIIEIEGPVIEAVEDNVVVIDESPKVEETIDNDVDEASEDVELLSPDFDCPGAGLYASPTNCGQYYQCTEEKTVMQNLLCTITMYVL